VFGTRRNSPGGRIVRTIGIARAKAEIAYNIRRLVMLERTAATYGEAESFGGLEVDDEFELAHLHHRQIGPFSPLKCGPYGSAGRIGEAAASSNRSLSL
jgi:hypothetical protein